MGICVSRTQKNKPPAAQESASFQVQPTGDKLVQFFDSHDAVQMMQSSPSQMQDFLERIYRNNAIKDEEVVAEVLRVYASKSEKLIRNYKVETNDLLVLLEKAKEFVEHYYKRYLNIKMDPQIIKKLLLKESLQVMLECIVIINTVQDQNFATSWVWWTEQYFRTRQERIASTFPPTFNQTSLQQMKQPNLDNPYLLYLQDLKLRMAVSISIEQSQDISVFKSHQESKNIQEQHLNEFYVQNLKAVLMSQELN